MVQEKINTGRHTDHPAERHSIWTNQWPQTSPIFALGALPAATCPLNPGLGQAPNTQLAYPVAWLPYQRRQIIAGNPLASITAITLVFTSAMMFVLVCLNYNYHSVHYHNRNGSLRDDWPQTNLQLNTLINRSKLITDLRFLWIANCKVWI